MCPAGEARGRPRRPKQAATMKATCDSRARVSLTVPSALVNALASAVTDALVERGVVYGDPSTPWLNVAQAAEYMAAKPQRIYDLVHAGLIEPGRDGRRLVFHRDDLDAYLRGRGDV